MRWTPRRPSGVAHGSLHLRDIVVSVDATVLTGMGIAAVLERVGVRPPVRRPYCAPEVALGRGISPAADQYALAAIAHEWLSGRRLAGNGVAGFACRCRPCRRPPDDALQAVFARAWTSRRTSDSRRPPPSLRPSSRLSGTLRRAPGRAGGCPLSRHRAWCSMSRRDGSLSPAMTSCPPETRPVGPTRARVGRRPHRSPRGPTRAPSCRRGSGVGHDVAAPTDPRRTGRSSDDEAGAKRRACAISGRPKSTRRRPARSRRPKPDGDQRSTSSARTRRLGCWVLVLVLATASALTGGWLLLRWGTPAPAPDLATARRGRRPRCAADRECRPGSDGRRSGRAGAVIGVSRRGSAGDAAASGGGRRATRHCSTAAGLGPPDPVSAPRRLGPRREPASPRLSPVGRVLVRTTPGGAEVFVNGERRGVTPLALRDLPFGAYTVTGRPGRLHAPVEQRVAIEAAGRRGRSRSPWRGRQRSPPAASRPRRRPRPCRRAACSSTAVPRARGSSSTAADVGVTPVTVADLAAGTHTVRIDRPGYRSHHDHGTRGGRSAGPRRCHAHGGKAPIDERDSGPGRRHLVRRRVGRRPRRDHRRSRVQHEHDRLSGGADRPVLRRPDRHHDGAADRQLRRRRRRRRVRRPEGGRLRHPRPVAGRQQLALAGHAQRLPDRQRHRRHRRHRHAGADAQAAVGRRDARRHRHGRRRPAGAGGAGARGAADGRHGPRAGRDLRGALRLRAVAGRCRRRRDLRRHARPRRQRAC